MYSEMKIKRLRRIQKLKRQRTRAFLSLIAIMIFAINAWAYTNVTARSKYTVKSVVVEHGDTIWNIAMSNKPEGKDIRAFVNEISVQNNIKNATIHEGQELHFIVK